jgi:hypothetical protein
VTLALAPGARRAAFASLGAVALLAIVVAAVAILAPLRSVQWWLIGCLAALVLVLAVEVVLLILDKREGDEVYEFVIEGEAP